MENDDVAVQVLPDYQLKLYFPNGSKALINMSKRVQAVRFGRLSDLKLFATARVEGSEVVWKDGTQCVRASINELLDSMQMD